MTYVDGFLLVIKKKDKKAYQAIAKKAGKVWMNLGAISYVECIEDDLKVMNGLLDFRKLVKLKKDESVVFSWITYKSKAQRNSIIKKVMKDESICEDMGKKMPFDMKRMSSGGFKPIVEFSKKSP